LIATEFSFALYPNPVKDYLYFTRNAENRYHQARIYSITGQCLMEQQLTESARSIDLQRLPGGIYFVQFTGADTAETHKIIKQ
jgi:hypothetical protein